MRRTSYAVLALCTIAIGLTVFLAGDRLAPAARDVLGDALWAAMIVWWVSTLAPRQPLGVRAGVSLGVCVAIEVSQLLHTPALDAVRRTTPGHLVLGSGFDARDVAAYTAGVGAAALLDAWWRRREVD